MNLYLLTPPAVEPVEPDDAKLALRIDGAEFDALLPGLIADEFLDEKKEFNARRFSEVLAHEIVGHHGIESLVRGASFDALVQDVHRLARAGEIDASEHDGNGQVARDSKHYATVEAVERAYTENGVEPSPTLVAMEVLARMAEQNVNPGFVRRGLDLLRQALRPIRAALGLPDTPTTVADLRNIVRAAQRHVKRGDNTLLPPQEAKALEEKQLAQDKPKRDAQVVELRKRVAVLKQLKVCLA